MLTAEIFTKKVGMRKYYYANNCYITANYSLSCKFFFYITELAMLQLKDKSNGSNYGIEEGFKK